jgi:hypothetical protein
MQTAIIGIAAILAFVPLAFVKDLSSGNGRGTRIVRSALFAVAVLSGGASMGCWLLTQSDAGITPQEGPATIALLYSFFFAFLAVLGYSSYLGHRKESLHSILRSLFFLIGVSGFSVMLFFTLTSRGLIFKFGPVPFLVLLISLACIAVTRFRTPSDHTLRS